MVHKRTAVAGLMILATLASLIYLLATRSAHASSQPGLASIPGLTANADGTVSLSSAAQAQQRAAAALLDAGPQTLSCQAAHDLRSCTVVQPSDVVAALARGESVYQRRVSIGFTAAAIAGAAPVFAADALTCSAARGVAAVTCTSVAGSPPRVSADAAVATYVPLQLKEIDGEPAVIVSAPTQPASK